MDRLRKPEEEISGIPGYIYGHYETSWKFPTPSMVYEPPKPKQFCRACQRSTPHDCRAFQEDRTVTLICQECRTEYAIYQPTKRR